MATSTASSPRKPWLLTLVGLATIAALLILPGQAGPPDGEKVPDMVRFLGRFHPVMLHLPIGMVSLALFLEIARFFTRKSERPQSGAGSLVLGLAAATSVIAVILGFLLYQGGGYETSKVAERHMWGGIYFACAMIFTFMVKAWSDSTGGRGDLASLSRLTLFTSAGVMAFASHDGGSLSHGEKYLTEFAPTPVRKVLGLPAKSTKEKTAPGEEKSAPAAGGTPLAADAPAKTPDQQVVYTDLVAPILEKKCTSCHGTDKTKGKLRLDTYELIVKGGKNGPAAVAGDLVKSHLIARINLPKDDEEHMPPEEKPQIEPHELAILKWWVTTGADPKKTVAELAPTPEVTAALAKLGTRSSGKAPAVAKKDPEYKDEAGNPIPVPSAKPPVAASGADQSLKKQVAGFAKDFPGALTFESQQSPFLTFTAVSLREHLDDDGFAKLVPVMKHLITADLSATKVTDRSVVLLAAAEDLRMVRLSETGVTDAAIDSLLKLPKLESVNLYGTAVTDAGVAKLASLPNLKRLYLWQSKVTPQGVEDLKKKLPNCEIVTGA